MGSGMIGPMSQPREQSVSYESVLTVVFGGDTPTDDDWKVQKHQSFDDTGTIVASVGDVPAQGLAPGDTLRFTRDDDGVPTAYNVDHDKAGPPTTSTAADTVTGDADWPKRLSKLKWMLSDGTEIIGEVNAKEAQIDIDLAAEMEAEAETEAADEDVPDDDVESEEETHSDDGDAFTGW